jgi:polyhydroxyalkanoate synthesis repressor PhaR
MQVVMPFRLCCRTAGEALLGGKFVPNEAIRIKRYPNRRFYASHTRKYVSLSEIEAMIRSGADVEIVDSATGEDITRVILIQMIAEQHPDKAGLFPTAMLHSILRANTAVVRFWREYLRNSLACLDYFQWNGTSKRVPEPMQWMKAWLDSWPQQPSGVSHGAAKMEPTDTEERSDVTARIAELEQRIKELEQQRSTNK